jgi:hypothetical protein
MQEAFDVAPYWTGPAAAINQDLIFSNQFAILRSLSSKVAAAESGEAGFPESDQEYDTDNTWHPLRPTQESTSS